MNIAFFGTSDKSVPVLEALHANFNLALCVTKADTTIGRKHELKETQVKMWAKEHAIPYFQITNMTQDKEALEQELIYKNVELGVVADFGFIIPNEILITPRHGLINIHFSLLPRYRGASPVQFAILNGDKQTGITYQLMAEKLDEGDIIYQSEYKLTGNETTERLYTILFELAAEQIPEVISNYVGGKYKLKQQKGQVSYTISPSHPTSTQIYKDDAKINWKEKPEQIEQKIRAYYPWPIAWTTLGEMTKFGSLKPDKDPNKRVKLYKAHLKNRKLEITKLQVEGKGMLTWQEFVNGYFASVD